MHTQHSALLLGLVAVAVSVAVGCAAPTSSSDRTEAPDPLTTADFAFPVQALTDMAQKPSDLATTTSDLAQPVTGSGDMAQPVQQTDMAQPSCASNCYKITVIDAEVPAFKPDGANWDSSTGPDPYVKVQAFGGRIGSSPTVSDSYFPTYNSVVVTLPYVDLLKSMTVLFKEYDASFFNADDDIASWTFTLTAAEVTAGTKTLTTPDGYVKLGFAPQ